MSPWGSSDGNKLYGNFVHFNMKAEVFFSSSYSNGNEVSDNVVRSNGSNGALIGYGTTGNKLHSNTIDGNHSHGIESYEDASSFWGALHTFKIHNTEI